MRKEELVTLPLCVQDYLNYLNVVKNKSELTILEYASDLRLFTRFEVRRYNPSLTHSPLNRLKFFQLMFLFMKSSI